MPRKAVATSSSSRKAVGHPNKSSSSEAVGRQKTSSSSRKAVGHPNTSSSSRKAVGHPKARYDLIPPNALHQVALAFAYGEEKHKDNPKEKGRSWRGEFAALMRHAWAPVCGDFYDPETKLCHWAHAVARGLILLEFFITEAGTDDLIPGKQKEKAHARN